MIAGFFILLALFSLFLIGGMTFVIYRLIKKSKNTTPQDKIAAAKKLIDKHRPKLSPWQKEDFFSLKWPQTRHSSKGFSMEKKVGYIRDNEGEIKIVVGYADFSAVHTKAQILFANTLTGLILECNKEGFTLKHRGEVLGHHRYNGFVYDTVGNKIGFLNRKRGAVSSFEFDIMGFDIELFRKNTNVHFAFQFAGGLTGSIHNPASDQGQGRLFEFINGTPTEEQQLWLLALAVHLYFGD